MVYLPPIDFAAVCSSSPDARRRQFELLDVALSTLGYVHLRSHGIPSSELTELFDVTREFFEAPDSVHRAVAQPAPEQVRGFSGLGSEGIAYSLDEESHGDLKEKMDIGPIDTPVIGESGAHDLAFPNLWPSEVEGFRPAWETYYRHMQRIGTGLLSMTAEGFGLPGDHFDPLFDQEMSMLRALHFPPQATDPLPYQHRAGTHTDYGAFTIVCAESTAGGLQIFDREGEWLDVTTTPDDLVILVGDLLAEWTANHWSATVHRTANPSRSVGFETSRLAFAYYQHPNHDVAITELPPFAAERMPAPQHLLAGEHLVEKYVRQTTFGGMHSGYS
ncbi:MULTISPECIES: isopenicillin N synthase family dioxygenase [Dietzia]|uniref:isopenicillin N synthase family dioxygenase n=1 Tax=Dietzia TaxID=37914 RepID=UPI0007838F88|nr:MULTISPECIES: 2-oxoglutarate and iron-dependent oxygenase domain-containing protein [Dietzia]MCT2058471.1 isopenicillin N synthase family oxygenase [Dietzia cinnamea]MCT2121961.1 isopenicillin N synthase family oxygenase [Dietzia cinnamea]MCT2146086.1 isopenicillin N synthase family oxygenase [Dietzia cinnamea]MCT2305405.1 isopenicillin N synthase family oxygenase [Dietzia cinnamea]